MGTSRAYSKGYVEALCGSISPLTNGRYPVYSVVLDIYRNLACSGSMDGTVRVWNLSTGQCQHVLTGHTSLVGLLGLSPSSLVSAAADSTLRVWDPESGELRHTLAAHNGAITCFQHDEFKVLSGSDGTLKIWDIRDGTQVRDLLTGIAGVWQVVFEGRWCIVASNRENSTVLDVWDFGLEGDEEWEGEPPGGIYDEESEDEDEGEQAEVDVMEQDFEVGPSDSDDVLADDPDLVDDEDERADWSARSAVSRVASRSLIQSEAARAGGRGRLLLTTRDGPGSSSAGARARPLPSNDETPTRPRIRNALNRRR